MKTPLGLLLCCRIGIASARLHVRPEDGTERRCRRRTAFSPSRTRRNWPRSRTSRPTAASSKTASSAAKSKLAMLQERAGLDQQAIGRLRTRTRRTVRPVQGHGLRTRPAAARAEPATRRSLAAISQPAIRSRDRHQQARHRHPLRQRRGRAEARRRRNCSTSWCAC